MEKEYVEKVLDKKSTHAIIRKAGDNIVYDLIIKSKDTEGNEMIKVLATDRTYKGLPKLTAKEKESLLNSEVSE